MATQPLPSFLLPTTIVRPRNTVARPLSPLSHRSDRLEDVIIPGAPADILAPFDSPGDMSPPNILPGGNDSESGGAPVVATQKIVAGVAMTGQEQSNWCWAAVTQAVRDWAGSAATQPDIATSHIQASGRPYTCVPPNAAVTAGRNCAPAHQCQGSCNDQHILSVVLGENGRLQQALPVTPTFTQVKALLDADLPVPCRVKWNQQAGHFIMVYGWTIDASGEEKVHVLDPATAAAGAPVSARIWRFSDFVTSYSISCTTGTINYIYEVH